MNGFSTFAVFLVTFLGTMSYFPGSALVEAKSVVVKVSKDATLGMGQHGYCPEIPVKCDFDTANCPFCNQGSASTVTVSYTPYPTSALIGFNLSLIPSKAKILSCKLQLPKPAVGGQFLVKGPFVRINDTSYYWKENKVTYNTRPAVTSVGSYGIFDPWKNPVLDVTRGCKNRGRNGNGLSILFAADPTVTPSIELLDISYPSRESGAGARLTINYQ